MHLMYLLSIAAAERNIDLDAAYFVPDVLIIKASVGTLPTIQLADLAH